MYTLNFANGQVVVDQVVLGQDEEDLSFMIRTLHEEYVKVKIQIQFQNVAIAKEKIKMYVYVSYYIRNYVIKRNLYFSFYKLYL